MSNEEKAIKIPHHFFKMYRRKGINETIAILMTEEEGMKQTTFFKLLVENKSYLNSYFRVKPELLKYKLIQYYLDEENEMCLTMTAKGKELWRLINDIEIMLVGKDSNLVDKLIGG